MKQYKHILVAVELNSRSDSELIKHAEILDKEYKAHVVLLHAIEHIGSYSSYGVGGIGFEVEELLIKQATKEMNSLGEKIGIPEDRQIVKIGPAKFVILEEAEKMHADLIIVGSHGRQGLRAILGSTADGVLHGAKCDVLAVRLKK